MTWNCGAEKSLAWGTPAGATQQSSDWIEANAPHTYTRRACLITIYTRFKLWDEALGRRGQRLSLQGVVFPHHKLKRNDIHVLIPAGGSWQAISPVQIYGKIYGKIYGGIVDRPARLRVFQSLEKSATVGGGAEPGER